MELRGVACSWPAGRRMSEHLHTAYACQARAHPFSFLDLPCFSFSTHHLQLFIGLRPLIHNVVHVTQFLCSHIPSILFTQTRFPLHPLIYTNSMLSASAVIGSIDPALSADLDTDSNVHKQIPPINTAMPPHQQQQQPPPDYRNLPAPQQMYPGAYPQHQMAPGYPTAQPAPRQRTAIACRYCRRRKV